MQRERPVSTCTISQQQLLYITSVLVFQNLKPCLSLKMTSYNDGKMKLVRTLDIHPLLSKYQGLYSLTS